MDPSMEVMTTVEIIAYIVSCILFYYVGFISGEIRQEYKEHHPRKNHQKKRYRRRERTVDMGFDPNNPINRNHSAISTTEDTYVDEEGNVWYIRRPIK